MVNKALSRAINSLLFAVRMRIVDERMQQGEGARAPLLGAGAGTPEGAAVLARLSTTPPYQNFSRNSVKDENAALTMAADSLRKNVVVSDIKALWQFTRDSWASLLLVSVPLGIYAGATGWVSWSVFFINFAALIPLALMLGNVTEDLALRMGDVAGGLLNATFGNVTEIVLSLAALNRGLFDVVADSLLGSILSNMLLVLGTCFLVGGYYYKNQTFNATSNRANSSLLLLASMGIAMPTAAANMISDPGQRVGWVLDLSRCCAVVLLICYVMYLVFQLYTHQEVFDEEEEDEESLAGGSQAGAAKEPELPVLSVTGAVLTMACISVLVAVHSEFLTGAIEETSKQTGVSTSFLAMIILPIAGNACEHLAAVIVAAKNKMDLSLGIALGSSLQIALFAIPLAVVVGWCIGQPMSLDYDQWSVIALVLSVIHAGFVTNDATSHWLMGVQLIASYVLIALVFWFR